MVVKLASDLIAASAGTHSARYVMDVFYDGRPTLTGLSLDRSGSLRGSATARIQTQGRVLVRSDAQILDGQGNTIAPKYATDILASYGQEVVISREVRIGSQVVGLVPLGRFAIYEVPSIEERARRFSNTRVSTASTVELSLRDLFERVDAADFTTYEAPKPGNALWEEVRRISPLPVVQSLPNTPIASTAIYPENRLDALTDLFALIGAQPHMTREGALTARLSDPFSAAGVTPVDLTGTLMPMERSMSGAFYNIVIVTAVISGTATVLAESRIKEGPLRAGGPAGDRVYRRTAGLATSAQAAQNLADSVLAEQLRNRTRTVQITCLPNLQLELGDPVTARDPQTDRVETGIVTDYSWNMDPTALMTVEISTKATE